MGEMSYYELATRFLAENYMAEDQRTLHLVAGGVWAWEGDRYKLLENKALSHKVMRWLQLSNLTSLPATRDRIVENVEAILAADNHPNPPCWLMPQGEHARAEKHHHWIAFRNGVLDLTEAIAGRQVLVPHSPRWFSSVVLPYEYSVDVGCPLWVNCVSDWMRGDASATSLLQEFAGYLLIPDASRHTALCLEGPGSNGKNTFLEGLLAMLGESNYSAVPLESFNKQFQLVGTVGKLLNIATETDPGIKLPVETLKKYISGDPITIDRKYNPYQLTFRPTARLIVLWNERPHITDTSNGFWRRVKLVPFLREYSPQERDLRLAGKLRGEAPGIFNWALEGLRRLSENDTWTECRAVDSAIDNFRATADPARAFLKDTVTVNPAGVLSKNDLYNAYSQWCLGNGNTPLTPEEFSKAVFRCCPGTFSSRPTREGQRYHAFNGIDWAKPKEESP